MRKKNRRARGFFLSSPVSNSAKPKNPLQSPFSSRLILLKVPSANLQQKGLLLKKRPCWAVSGRVTAYQAVGRIASLVDNEIIIYY
jgi:hypothetical protein